MWRYVTKRQRKPGIAVLYVVIFMTVGLAIASLAVDYGTVQLAKTQLRMAADSAARASVQALGGSVSSVQDIAVQYAAANTCNGTAVAISKNSDIEFLDWNPLTRTYSVLTGSSRNYAN